jgi:ABC-2 type transport system permease protein
VNVFVSIFKKEVKGFLNSPFAYVISAVVLALGGYFFFTTLFVTQIADLTGVFMNLGVVLIFAIPVLTMKLLAGEKQEGTMEFLLTSPVTIPQIIISKYLAALVYFIIIVLLTLTYPGILFTVSSPDKGVIFTTYVGFFLLVATYLAIGVLCSSLTSSQVIASILSFGILLLLWIFGWLSGKLSGPLGSLAKTLSIFEHYGDFLRGIIDTTHIVYFLGIIIASLIFSMFGITKPTLKLPYIVIIITLIIAIVVTNLAAAKYHFRYDLTKTGRFTLSEKTKEVIRQLKQPIKITAFIAEGSNTGSDIKNLLKEYSFVSPNITVSFCDPKKDPSMAKKYNVQDYNTIIVEDINSVRTISQYNLYAPGSNQYLMDFNGEQAVTRAILDLENQTSATIYFLAGHGEASLISDLEKFNLFLKGEGYITKRLELLIEGKIPEGLSVNSLLVTSPEAFGETELEKSQVYLDENDIRGPLHVAFAVSKVPNKAEQTSLLPNTISAPFSEAGEAIAVIVGNIAFLGPQTIGLAGNLDFAAGSINWLLQTPNLLSIPAKTQAPPFVNLTSGTADKIFYTTVVILPLIIVTMGFAVWLRRRNL